MSDLGDDWQLLQQMDSLEQEQRAEETLRQIYDGMVLRGTLNEKRFNELVYLTGVRAKFGDDNGKYK